MKGVHSSVLAFALLAWAPACGDAGAGDDEAGATGETGDTGETTDTGASLPSIECPSLPDGAAGAEYAYAPTVSEGALLDSWIAEGLPAGLSIDGDSGLITGVPEGPAIGEASELFDAVVLFAIDEASGQQISASCGPLTIFPPLNALGLVDELGGCLPASLGYELLAATLSGGDGSDLSCRALAVADDPICPLGEGNGRPAPGLSFDEASCAHTGEISGDRRGSWAWMIEVEQSGRSILVPVCASSEGAAYHDIELRIDGELDDELEPAIYSFDPDAELSFGGGSHRWDIIDPLCPGADCNNFGYRWAASCSPFLGGPPWVFTLSPSGATELGLFHGLTATGAPVGEELRERPFVVDFEIAYCTSADAMYCDVQDPDAFAANAQTRYRYAIVAYPALAGP